MKRIFISLVACTLLFSILAGCKSYQRVVHNNTLYSGYNPKVEMAVNPDMKYVGNRDKQQLTSPINEIHASTSIRRAWWAFVEADEYKNAPDYIKRGMFIDVEELPPTYNGAFISDLLSHIEHKLAQGTDKVLGKDYNWAVYATTWPFAKDQEAYLKSLEYNLPSPCMVRLSIRKISNTAVTSVFYFESIEDNHLFFGEIPARHDSGYFSKDFVNGFLARSREAIEFQKYTGEGLPQEPQEESDL